MPWVIVLAVRWVQRSVTLWGVAWEQRSVALLVRLLVLRSEKSDLQWVKGLEKQWAAQLVQLLVLPLAVVLVTMWVLH